MSFHLNLNTESVDQCELAELLCLAPSDSVAEALRQMKQRGRGAVIICRENRVVGIFTERDVLAMMAAGQPFDVPLEQVMIAQPVVLHARDKVAKAIELMAQVGYRRLPIVDDRGCPTGMLTVEAIMRYLVEHFPTTIYNLPPEPHHTTQQREGA